MEKVSMSGKMEENMKDSINLIKSMGQENILGLMEEDIMAIGRTVNDMDKVRLFTSMVHKNKVCGKMTKE